MSKEKPITKQEVLKAIDSQATFQTRDAKHPFSSGRTGWYGYGPVVIANKRYQLSMSLAEVVKGKK